jgi:hypothetical protein
MERKREWSPTSRAQVECRDWTNNALSTARMTRAFLLRMTHMDVG